MEHTNHAWLTIVIGAVSAENTISSTALRLQRRRPPKCRASSVRVRTRPRPNALGARSSAAVAESSARVHPLGNPPAIAPKMPCVGPATAVSPIRNNSHSGAAT